jgi:hypothetical protein
MEHLRVWADVRIASGIALVGLGVVTLSFGGDDWKTYGWTMVFLALAAAQFSFAYWELTIARSASPRTWACATRAGLAGARRAGGLSAASDGAGIRI